MSDHMDESRPIIEISESDIEFQKAMTWESKKRDFKHHFRKLNHEEQKEVILILTEIFLGLDNKESSNDQG